MERAAVRVRDLGEFGLIERLSAYLRRRLPPSPAIALGIGDDAALWHPTPGWISVLSTDSMIEGVHFTKQTTPWHDLGWKSLAVNVSDLAAMAAEPRFALITLALTGEEEVAEIDALYEGIADCAILHNIHIIGGDTVRAPQVQVGFAVTGEVRAIGSEAAVLRRAAAKPGDLLVITGHPGDAAAGLAVLRSAEAGFPTLVAAHRRPLPCVREAAWLYDQGVRCATDSSDGLRREVELLCVASGVDAWIDAERLPLSPALLTAFPRRAAQLALYGGEDYDLVMAVSAARFPAIEAAWTNLFAAPFTAVGAFVEAAGDSAAVQVHGYQGDAVEFEHFVQPAS